MKFTDERGREWAVYDYSVIAGKVLYFPVGSSGAGYRGFAPVDVGARRIYLFKLKDDRAPMHDLLKQQLAASSLYYKDDPAVYDAMRTAGLPNVGAPERVDPGADP